MPKWSLILTVTPAFNSNKTESWFPEHTARCRALRPKWSLSFILAPRLQGFIHTY